MAEFVMINVQITVDGTDLSNHTTNCNFAVSKDMPEATAFTNTYRRFLPGLKDLELGLNFNADYATGSVDDIIWTNWDDGSAFDVVLLPDSLAGVGPDNPEYTLNVYAEAATILTGSPGDIAKYDATFKNASGSISRATA